ncbi:divergent polysaccharide deacetylase family protein [Ruegeria sp. HKCCD8929]|uniref:divergent polysaccharide deacetylase family protein n=1 Tax=Ruegeria sp. HKCCD8929 TaxID=2683006 RepID=UPI001489AC75|nr:divergent polysaccharide deacetylase family protein [Ruegeria sp. HKCCD8929]
MGRFLGGLITGAIVMIVVAVLLSLAAPLPQGPELASDVPAATPAGAEPGSSEIDEPGTDADLVEAAPHAPESSRNGPDTLEAIEEADTAPAEQPDVGSATAELGKPAAGSETDVEVESVAPVAPPSPASLPESPTDDIQPVVVDDQPSQPAPPEVAELPGSKPEAQPTAESGITAQRPRLAALPQIGGDQSGGTGTGVGTRVVPLTERDEAPAAPQLPQVDPIIAYASKFENPEDKPLMSIVLIDDENSLGAEALQDFPYPLSFAVSPTDPDAAAKMARYRAAGFEVLALTDMPEAATAQDAEVSLSVWLETLPETVAILEGTQTGIQGNRKLADQVSAIAGGTGRGLVTQDNGLNTVQKLAARNGVPSAVVFRDFDGAGQEAKVMRRFLDQAAFRAGQEGAVVMLGRVRPETISALLVWGLQDRASRVALAPISAALQNDQQ